MRTRAWARGLAALLCVVCGPVVWGAEEGASPVRREVRVLPGVLEVEAGQSWGMQVTAPSVGPDEALVLVMRARLQTVSPGGCNYVMQVLLDDSPLTENPMRPRLVNKPAWIDPPGTKYHFCWYGADQRGWMTIFAPRFEGDWGGTGRDYDFSFDLSGLVVGGQVVRLGLRHLMPEMPAALGAARAPLVVDGLALRVLPRAEVERLRGEALRGQEPRAVPVTAELPGDAKPGERAYEVVWSGRREDPRTQVAFDDLTGWTAQAIGDTEVALAASVEQLLWRPRVAMLSYEGATSDTVVEIRPPKPIPIRGRFDAANLWLYGAWDRAKDPQLRFVAVLEDRAGQEYEVDLGPVTASYWGLQHGVLSPRLAAQARFPMRFVALRVSNLRTAGARKAYLESLVFYQQDRRPPIASAGRDGARLLTSDEGMLPTPPPDAEVSVVRVGQGARFCSRFREGSLRFDVRPEAGVLEGVTARWNDGPRFRPMAGGGVALDPPDGGALKRAEVVSSSVRDGRLSVRWRLEGPEGPVEWEADYSLRGCTLVVDVRCGGGRATGLDLGQVAGLTRPRGIEVPYLLMGQKPGPWVACADDVFVSVLPDWYHSDFSTVDTQVTPPAGNRIGLLKGTGYLPLTDGRRNPLRDRVLVTVSPEFADTLPNARNPVSPNRERLAPYMFYMADQLNPGLYRALKGFGVDHLIASDFAAIVVANNYAEGFAMRWRPHPMLTLEQVQEYRRGIKELGYLFSTYMDSTDYYPGNALWDERKACLTSDGDLLDGWWGNYVAKPGTTAGLIREVGRESREAYASDCVYLDVHTNRGPQALDFEAGARGAGMAREQVLANGECIAEARKWYGSTISEGLYRWMYAGLCDMDYATLITSGTAGEQAPLVDFDLLKIHPYQHGTMMGHHPDRFLNGVDCAILYQDSGRGLGPEAFHKYVAGSLAYGHMAMAGYWYTPAPARFVHLYALMQGVQKEYLTDNAVEIRYHNGSELVSTSEALKDGSQELGRVCVRYSRGLKVFVNYNAAAPWVVEAEGRSYELGPYGWLAEKPGEILAYSALVKGQRVDFVSCPEYVYLNTGGARVAQGPVEAQGAVWLKREGTGWRVRPCGDLGQWERFAPPGLPSRFSDFRPEAIPPERGCGYLVLDAGRLVGRPGTEARITAMDDAGEAVEAQVRQSGDGRVQLLTGEGVAAFVIE